MVTIQKSVLRLWLLGAFLLLVSSLTQSCTCSGSGITDSNTGITPSIDGCGSCLNACLDSTSQSNKECISSCSNTGWCKGYFGQSVPPDEAEKAAYKMRDQWRAANPDAMAPTATAKSGDTQQPN